ncbi:hypothetical protein [Antiquaquibacter soli]|uniref:Uncharacterized protein n=1 Tax=Antiquaquibacter soli TaxID=3064523 RepID=A0ABT9BLV8_9MICO|nr:hypothetical protein [Protaetiibacter sp. WY-16]MDO7881990.1 hypothetical protein [Protaetiibacter sp. WY-16]
MSYGTPWTIGAVVTGDVTVGQWATVSAEGVEDQWAQIVATPTGGTDVALQLTPEYTLPIGTWSVRVSVQGTDATGASVTLESANSVQITVLAVTVDPDVRVEKSGDAVVVTAGIPGLIPHVADAGSWLISFAVDGEVVESLSRVGLETGPVTVEWYPTLPGTEFELTVVWRPLSSSVRATTYSTTFVSSGTPPSAGAAPTSTRTPSPTASPAPTPSPRATDDDDATLASSSGDAGNTGPLIVLLIALAVVLGVALAVVLILRRRVANAAPDDDAVRETEPPRTPQG